MPAEHNGGDAPMISQEREELHRLLDSLLDSAPDFGQIDISLHLRRGRIQLVDHSVRQTIMLDRSGEHRKEVALYSQRSNPGD